MAAAKKTESSKETSTSGMQRPPSEVIYAGELSKRRADAASRTGGP